MKGSSATGLCGGRLFGWGALLFLAAVSTTTVAAADQFDQPPHLRTIEFDGASVVFNRSIRMDRADWASWPKPLLPLSVPAPQAACELPPDATLIWRDPGKPDSEGQDLRPRARVLYCDPGETWFAADREVLYSFRASELFSYSDRSRLIWRRGYVPVNEVLTATVRVGSQLWIASAREFDKAIYGGSGIRVFGPEAGLGFPDEPAETCLEDHHILAMRWHSAEKTVWVTTDRGVHRYSTQSRSWEHRYFTVESVAGESRLGLSLEPE